MLSTSGRPAAQDRLDRVFGALSDRTRRALYRRLARGPAIVTELAAPFRMSLPAISRHLKVLENAGLIVRKVDGRTHRCSLSAAPLREVDRWLARYRPFWEQTLAALAEYAERGSQRGHRGQSAAPGRRRRRTGRVR
jgi:DNA-binding transcriptional ArsR family regulator